jgi:hypothetical protein
MSSRPRADPIAAVAASSVFDAEGKIVRKDSFWKIRETR